MTDHERLQSVLGPRYHLERELAVGGMAEVFLATDLRHKRRVAIKVLRADLTGSLADRFHREIQFAAALQHPHIVSLLDSGESDGVLYYIMPFVDGESLRNRLERQHELPIADAVHIISEIVDALAYAHAHGVVHRDIKPENVMLSGRHALVVDFGVAKAISEATSPEQLTAQGVALGTPAYMAPEQVSADPDLDQRVDFYAVGCLAYELLSGRPPFTGLTAQETLAAQIAATPVDLRSLRPAIPAALSDVIMRCLEKRPADRWQSAEALRTQLDALVVTAAESSPAGPPGERPGVRRHLTKVAAALMVTGLLALVAIWTVRDDPLPDFGQMHPVTSDAGMEIEPALSPDGRFIAYSAGGLDRMRIFVRQQGGRPIAVTPDTGPTQRRPSWSPDNRQLLFLQGSHLVVVPAPLGGAVRTLVRAPTGRAITSAQWSPDGLEVAYIVGDSLFVMSAGDGKGTVVGVRAGMFSPAWSPDGRYLALVIGDARYAHGGAEQFGNIAPSAIAVIARKAGAWQDITDASALNVSPVWSPDARFLWFVSDRGGRRDVYRIAVSDGAADGEPQRVTTGLDAHSISLSSDGRRIAYTTYAARANLWAVPIEAGRVTGVADARQLTSGSQVIETVSLSADGRRLYFDSDKAGNSDIYRMQLPDGEPEPITRDPTAESSPDESSDGRWVAYHSFKFGNRDIFVASLEGGEPIRLTSDTLHERIPVWSPDGRRLLYNVRATGPAAGRHLIERRSDGSWGSGRQLGMTGLLEWLDDSTFVTVRDGHPALVTIDGRFLRELYPRTRKASLQISGLRTVTQTGAVYLKSRDADGARSYWRVARGAREPVLIARLNDPRLPATRPEFATDGRFLYVILAERESDIHVADIIER